MAARLGIKRLEAELARWARVAGMPLAAKPAYAPKYTPGYALDYYNAGGNRAAYKIVYISATGGEYEPFGGSRYTAQELSAALTHMIALSEMVAKQSDLRIGSQQMADDYVAAIRPTRGR